MVRRGPAQPGERPSALHSELPLVPEFVDPNEDIVRSWFCADFAAADGDSDANGVAAASTASAAAWLSGLAARRKRPARLGLGAAQPGREGETDADGREKGAAAPAAVAPEMRKAAKRLVGRKQRRDAEELEAVEAWRCKRKPRGGGGGAATAHADAPTSVGGDGEESDSSSDGLTRGGGAPGARVGSVGTTTVRRAAAGESLSALLAHADQVREADEAAAERRRAKERERRKRKKEAKRSSDGGGAVAASTGD
eukprot:TRINITY_DN18333_c0_g2_i1.p1 TRINITY_DN18333_c0_g2~~TRINITY_DN18333_c0_g2_i1.p1  ORF type:complete len:282 (-),score=69.46 TRINITY_DN18333_c0_g2_i1:91-852(-)